MKLHISVKNYPLYVVDVMWRSGLQKFSSYNPRCKQETTCSPLPMLQHELFLDFFLHTPVYVWKFWNVIPLPPLHLQHTFNFYFLESADTPALDVTCFKKWQLSNTDYLRITNNQNLSTFHVCTAAAAAAATSITADADLADAALVKHVTDWMQVTSPFKVREFVLAVWDVMMCIFIILWSM